MRKLILINCLVAGIGVSAQTDSLKVSDFYIDFAVPDHSASSLLDLKASDITRPGNLKKFAASLSNALSPNGSIKPGVSLEYAPFVLTDQIKDDKWWAKRNFRYERLALSVGTAQHDSLGIRAALGIKWVILDHADPMGDFEFYKEVSQLASNYDKFQNEKRVAKQDHFESFIKKQLLISMDPENVNAGVVAIVNSSFNFIQAQDLKKNAKKIEEGTIPNPFNYFSQKLAEAMALQNVDTSRIMEEIRFHSSLYVGEVLNFKDDFNEFMKEQIGEKKERYKKLHWNDWAWQISGGIASFSLTGKYDNMQTEKYGVFTSFSIPCFNKMKKIKGQLLLQLKYEGDLNDSTNYLDRVRAGGRFLLGNSDNRFTVDLMYSNANLQTEVNGSKQETFIRYAVGAELKMLDGTWFEFAFGGQNYMAGDPGTSILTTFGFKHAIQTKRRFDIK